MSNDPPPSVDEPAGQTPGRTVVDQPGIYEMPAADYHADPVGPAPSLSRSIAHLMLEASPLHAWAQHPHLGGRERFEQEAGEDDEVVNVGSAVHDLFLEGGIGRVVHIPVDAYRTKDAKAQRDQALADGKIPLKTKQYDATMWLVDSLETFRGKTGFFTHGKPEQTLVWDEGKGLWCRARVDWLPDDPAAPLLDLKTTEGLATPGAWGRNAFVHGADLQAVMYERGCEFLRGEAPDGMLFVVVEQHPPHAIRVFGLDPVTIELGQERAAAARELWAQCLRTKVWPGYPPVTEWILPPPWIVRAWEESKIGGYGRAGEDTAFIERIIAQGNWGG